MKKNVRDHIIEGLQETANLWFQRARRLETCLAFFASVIKSGEPWTETCQREYFAAKAEEPPTPAGSAQIWGLKQFNITMEKRAKAAEAARDGAYGERNMVVAALAKLFPSGTARTEIPGWEPEWHGCVYIDLPTGQISFHFHDREAYLFDVLPPYTGEWDGHDTPEKYRRLAAIAKAPGGQFLECPEGK